MRPGDSVVIDTAHSRAKAQIAVIRHWPITYAELAYRGTRIALPVTKLHRLP